MLSAQEVVGLRVKDSYRLLTLADGTELNAHAVIIATGVSYRKLEAPGVESLAGAGVYYGAELTEGQSVRGEDILIVGGANSAGQAAVYFADYAKTVSMLVRGESLAASMSQYLIDRIDTIEKIKVLPHRTVAEVSGDGRLETVTIKHGDTGEVETVPASTLFVLIGAAPHTDWLPKEIARDDHGFVLTGFDLAADQRPRGWRLARSPYPVETSVPGVFAVGDVRHASLKRVAAAVGEGGMAIPFVHRYLSEIHA